jgi:hypothetical protein
MTFFGVLGVLALFFLGSNAPLGEEGQPDTAEARGGRRWLAIPGTGVVDWLGATLVTLGLAAQNLWLGQMRGGLVSTESSAADLFWFLLAFVGTLRGIALLAPLGETRRTIVPLVLFGLVIGAGAVVGAAEPDTMGTLVLGVLPALLGAIVLPLAIGRGLRVIQEGEGLNWQITGIVLTSFAVTYGCGILLARAAQGMFYPST